MVRRPLQRYQTRRLQLWHRFRGVQKSRKTSCEHLPPQPVLAKESSSCSRFDRASSNASWATPELQSLKYCPRQTPARANQPTLTLGVHHRVGASGMFVCAWTMVPWQYQLCYRITEPEVNRSAASQHMITTAQIHPAVAAMHRHDLYRAHALFSCRVCESRFDSVTYALSTNIADSSATSTKLPRAGNAVPAHSRLKRGDRLKRPGAYL